MNRILLFLSLFAAVSCQTFMDDGQTIAIDGKSEKLSIVFSHNINGETHPCGCRHFPLGGIPSVAGVLHNIKKERPYVYVDTGDMLFPSNNIPDNMHESLSFTADNVLKASSELGLSLIVPGDQDLSRGYSYFEEEAKKHDVTILCANLAEKYKAQRKDWMKIEHGPVKIYLVGLAFPAIFPAQHRGMFAPPDAAMERVLKEIKNDGYDPKNTLHRLILLSHGGMDRDVLFTKKFQEINWIIGAHSQSFVRIPREENGVKLVQVLSRNHHIGEIIIDLKKSRDADTYAIHEVRDELKDELNPNPWISFIDEHKKKLTEIQLKEQEQLSVKKGIVHFNTSTSCIECHDVQGDFWQGTPHSIAYFTLMNAGEKANMTCIKCHSLGAGESMGFIRQKDMVKFEYQHVHGNEEKKAVQSHGHDHGTDSGSHSHKDGKYTEAELEKITRSYWDEVVGISPKGKSIREMPAGDIRKIAQAWMEIDLKKNVTHNFSNVQCLNCHNLHPEHPFGMGGSDKTREQKIEEMKPRCLACHDPDQSPQWYENGRGPEPIKAVFDKHFKAVSCPRDE